MQDIPLASTSEPDGHSTGEPHSATPSSVMQLVVGVGVVLLAAAMAWGAISIPSNAGYGGIGPNFLPYLVAAVLAACGGILIWEASTGGYRSAEDPGGTRKSHKTAYAFVSAGLLTNAALIGSLGFVLSCTLCYVLAVQGLKRAAGQQTAGLRPWLLDVVTGLIISAPVYWMFTKFLAINLPGLTTTGWL